MLKPSAVVVLLLSLLVPAAGCGVGGTEAEEINRIEEVPVELSMKFRGDLDLTLTERITSRFIVRRTNDKERQKFQVLGVEPAEPVRAGNARFLAGVAVVPYQGDGEYTIPVGSPFDAAAAQEGQSSSVQSSIKVEWWPTGDLESEPERYMRRAKPCTVEVRENGTEGVLRCPDVTNEARDKHFSFELRWKAPRTPAPTTTITVVESTTSSQPPTSG